MFETPIHIVGNIVAEPVRRRVGDQDLTRLRVASNSRRRMPDGSWGPGDPLYVTVTCWGALATGVGGSLVKGDPVVVIGRLYTNEYLDGENNRRSSTEVRAVAVGPDLSRCSAPITSVRRPAGGAPTASSSDAIDGSDDPVPDYPDATDPDAVDPAAPSVGPAAEEATLSLSA